MTIKYVVRYITLSAIRLVRHLLFLLCFLLLLMCGGGSRDQTNVWIMQMQGVASLIVTVESVKEVRKNIIRRQCCGCSNLALIGMCLGIFNFGVGGLRLLLQLTDTTAGIFKDLNGLVFLKTPCDFYIGIGDIGNFTAASAIDKIQKLDDECALGRLIYDACEAMIGALQLLVSFLIGRHQTSSIRRIINEESKER